MNYLKRTYTFTLEQMKIIEQLQSRYALSDFDVLVRSVAFSLDVASAEAQEITSVSLQAKLADYFINLEDSSSLSLSSKRN